MGIQKLIAALVGGLVTVAAAYGFDLDPFVAVITTA